MKTYSVTIQARIVKTITVEADDIDQAYELAHDKFSVLDADDEEHYEQDTVDIKEISQKG
jgi:hypothetical protein